MLQLAGLSKGFGARTLFRDVGWTLGDEDRAALVGPNGAGKTTLLRILAGLEQADAGSISAARETTLGYLPQEVTRHEATPVLEHVLGGAGEVRALEAEIERVETSMSSARDDEAEALAARHADLLERYTALDGYTLEARGRVILTGLGFREADLAKTIDTLSGGWAMRAELARLLLARPTLLLLDEPTNHLDLESLAWLEEFLTTYSGGWVVVSHDRYFLNRMVTSVAELTPDGVFVFDGNYDDYVEARGELEERLAKEAADRQKRIDEMRSFVERFRAKASKARQAQSRLKMIEREERQGSASAGPSQRPRRAMNMQLPEPPRSGETVIRLEGVHKSYGERVVYAGVDLVARRGERLALVGENGAGKSTLLKLLAGLLEPDAGERQLGHNVSTYYFAQHQTDALRRDGTVLEEMREIMPDAAESRVRGVLGAFLFSGDDVDKRVSVLSGGEKSRLVLAKMLARPANLLLLDEPTNHLDLRSREVLEAALSAFTGTVVFISHDRYFINRIATKVVEVRPGGLLTEFPGDYHYYLWKRGDLDRTAPAQQVVQSTAPASGRGAREREERKLAQREAAKRAKEAARMEQEIHACEARLVEIDALLCDPVVYADAARCKALLDERRDLEDKLPPLYESWEQAAG